MSTDLPYRRVLISRMKFIGDIVLTTPIIRSVRHAMPEAFIAYLGEKEGVSLLENNSCLDEIIPFDFARPALIEQPAVIARLRKRNFDLAIDLFGNPRTALMTFLSGVPTRIGPARKGRSRLYTKTVQDDGKPKTAIEFHNQLLRAAGIEPTADRTEIVLTSDEKREARIYLQWLDNEEHPLDPTKPLIGIHPGATWPAKKWLPDRFGQLADLVRAKLGAEIILTGGKKDADTIRIVSRNSLTPMKVLIGLPLRQLAAIIDRCAVFVSNDAGPMHIAAALGVPTIGIFGPGEENIWFPYSAVGNVALRKDVPCHPCHLDVCNRTGEGYMECMKLLSVDEVFHEIETRLKH